MWYVVTQIHTYPIHVQIWQYFYFDQCLTLWQRSCDGGAISTHWSTRPTLHMSFTTIYVEIPAKCQIKPIIGTVYNACKSIVGQSCVHGVYFVLNSSLLGDPGARESLKHDNFHVLNNTRLYRTENTKHLRYVQYTCALEARSVINQQHFSFPT